MSFFNILPTNIFIFVLATVLAILEIQIEGEHGWAKNLPTWRPKVKNWAVKLYENMMSGKELTGYHLSMFGLVFLIFMLPFFLGAPLTKESFIKELGFYFIFVPLWDYIWFVLNPWYPLKDFQKNNVNHKAWFLGMPTDYYFSSAASLAVILVGEYLIGVHGLLSWWLINMGLFILETLVLVVFSLVVLDIDNWHTKHSQT